MLGPSDQPFSLAFAQPKGKDYVLLIFCVSTISRELGLVGCGGSDRGKGRGYSRAISKSEPQLGRAGHADLGPDSVKSLNDLGQATLQCWASISSTEKWASSICGKL